MLIADQLPQVEFFELLFLGQGLVALRVEFDADAIGTLLLDDFSDQIGGFARDVCGSDDDELTIADADDVNVAAVVALVRRVTARGLVGDVRSSLSMNSPS